MQKFTVQRKFELASNVSLLNVYLVSFTVQTGKNWIFVHNTSQRHGDLIAHYLLDRYFPQPNCMHLVLLTGV